MMMYVLNLALAGALGWALGGWPGAAVLMLIIAAMISAPAVLARTAPVWRALRVVLLVVSVPVAAGAAGAAMVVLWLANVIGAWLPAPGITAGIMALLRRLTAGASVARGLGNCVSPEVLPWTLANVIMLLVIACAIEGITVALYVALLAVPVMLLGLVMLALEEPGSGGDE
jgi:hypothetical protein